MRYRASPPFRAGRVARLALLTLLAAGCVTQTEPPATSVVQLALDPALCEAHCVDNVAAELYREGEAVPIGPPISGACGEVLRFDALPAGHRVQVRAWATRGLQTVLSGWSEPITVVVDDTVSPVVTMEAVKVPVVDTVSPEPAVLSAAGVELVLQGTDFGPGSGTSAVRVGETVLEATAWTSTEVRLILDESAAATTIGVTSCGVDSATAPVRLVPTQPARTELSPPGCDGLALRALAADGNVGHLAAACADGTGLLLALELDACALTPSTVALPSAPKRVAVVHPSGAPPHLLVLATDGVLSRVGSAGLEPAPGPGGPIDDVAAHGGTALALAGGQLIDLETNQPVFSPTNGEVLRVAARQPAPSAGARGAAPERAEPTAPFGVLGRAQDTTWVARLTPGKSPTPVPLDDCSASALAVGDWLAVGCSTEDHPDPGQLVGLDQADSPVTIALPMVPSAVALDARGDVAFAWGDGQLSVVSLTTQTLLRTWPLDGAGPMAILDDDRLMIGTAAAPLTLLAPWAGLTPCPEDE